MGDILWLGNMKKTDFESVAKEFNHGYMEKTNDIPTFPVVGKIIGYNEGWRCVCMTVQAGQSRVWVPFVIASGSPVTLLGKDAMLALGINLTNTASKHTVSIHGLDNQVVHYQPGDPRLQDVNLIGWSFFRDTRVFEFDDAPTGQLALFEYKKGRISLKTFEDDRLR
jgi:hypothetical protein